jgi:hypothetical protein
MSDFPCSNLDAAAVFNARAADKLGWRDDIPAGALADFPALSFDPVAGSAQDRDAFARSVLDFQSGTGLAADGKLGRDTWRKLLEVYDCVTSSACYVVVKGRRYPLDDPRLAKLRVYDGGGLDLHSHGDYTTSSKRANKPRWIMLHWASHSRKRAYSALVNRGVSSHFGADPFGLDQWLDIAHTAWHAGKWRNHNGIGIDVCQLPLVEHEERYKREGFDVEVIKNPARHPKGGTRGEKHVLTLEPRTAEQIRAIVEQLCLIFDIPLRVPRGSNGLAATGELWHGIWDRPTAESYRGVLCHGHVSKSRWDVNPWMDQLFADV